MPVILVKEPLFKDHKLFFASHVDVFFTTHQTPFWLSLNQGSHGSGKSQKILEFCQNSGKTPEKLNQSAKSALYISSKI